MVMVMVLLCQGIIFENSLENDNSALFFGYVTVMILSLPFVWSFFMLYKRKCFGDDRIFLSKVALFMLAKDTRDAVFQAYSSDLGDSRGLLEFQRHELQEKLSRQHFDELDQINGQVYQLGTVEFEEFARISRASALPS
jgi:hypothetical protein